MLEKNLDWFDVEAWAKERGLVVKSKGTLAKYPGSTHWHVAKPAEKGTLEFTYFPAQGRFWAKVHPSRSADWIMEVLETLD